MVRAAGGGAGALVKAVEELMDDVSASGEDARVRVYQRERLASDICLVIRHSGKKQKVGGSPLALRIVAEFKAIASVHHTIWHELKR